MATISQTTFSDVFSWPHEPCYQGYQNEAGYYNDVIMAKMASQITSLTIVYSTVIKRRSKKTSKLRATGLCAGNSPGTGEFPAQRASNAENIFIWWRHHDWHDTSSIGPILGLAHHSMFAGSVPIMAAWGHHDIETLSLFLDSYREIHRSPGDSPKIASNAKLWYHSLVTLNKLLRKHSSCRWLEIPICSCDVAIMFNNQCNQHTLLRHRTRRRGMMVCAKV